MRGLVIIVIYGSLKQNIKQSGNYLPAKIVQLNKGGMQPLGLENKKENTPL